MATILQQFRLELDQRGLARAEAQAVLDRYLQSEVSKPVRDRFNDPVSSYPPSMLVGIWRVIRSTALEWIDEAKPDHFARPMFT